MHDVNDASRFSLHVGITEGGRPADLDFGLVGLVCNIQIFECVLCLRAIRSRDRRGPGRGGGAGGAHNGARRGLRGSRVTRAPGRARRSTRARAPPARRPAPGRAGVGLHGAGASRVACRPRRPSPPRPRAERRSSVIRSVPSLPRLTASLSLASRARILAFYISQNSTFFSFSCDVLHAASPAAAQRARASTMYMAQLFIGLFGGRALSLPSCLPRNPRPAASPRGSSRYDRWR